LEHLPSPLLPGHLILPLPSSLTRGRFVGRLVLVV
jgi:hypothetical protein